MLGNILIPRLIILSVVLPTPSLQVQAQTLYRSLGELPRKAYEPES